MINFENLEKSKELFGFSWIPFFNRHLHPLAHTKPPALPFLASKSPAASPQLPPPSVSLFFCAVGSPYLVRLFAKRLPRSGFGLSVGSRRRPSHTVTPPPCCCYRRPHSRLCSCHRRHQVMLLSECSGGAVPVFEISTSFVYTFLRLSYTIYYTYIHLIL